MNVRQALTVKLMAAVVGVDISRFFPPDESAGNVTAYDRDGHRIGGGNASRQGFSFVATTRLGEAQRIRVVLSNPEFTRTLCTGEYIH